MMYSYTPSDQYCKSGMLKRMVNPLINLAVALILFGGVIHADTPMGKMGGLALHKGSAQIIENSVYVLELFPGQSFDGWWYFWTDGDPLSAQLEETPEVSWLTITPSQFTITDIDTVVVKETFSYDIPGDYFCYEVWTAQYFNWPEYTLWNLSVLSDISDPNAGPLSTTYALYQNFPNPFNPETNIGYTWNKSGSVTLKIYDVNGQEVRSLVNEIQSVGSHSVGWDGYNNIGQPVASGIYIYRIETADFTSTRKMILMR